MANLTISNRSAADTPGRRPRRGARAGDDGADLAPGHGLPRKSVSHLKSVIADLELAGKVGEVTTLAAVPDVAAKLVVLAGVGALVQRPTARSRTSAKGVGAAIRSLSKKKKVAVVVPGTSRRGRVRRRRGRGPRGVCRVQGAARRSTDAVRLGRARRSRPTRPRARPSSVLRRSARPSRTPATWSTCRRTCSTRRRSSTRSPTASGHQGQAQVLRHEGAAAPAASAASSASARARPTRRGSRSSATPRPGPKASIAFVGKGITFDSGGLCIKPANGMLTMKCDMAGAAAVAASRPRHRRARSARRRHRLPLPGREHAELARRSARATS